MIERVSRRTQALVSLALFFAVLLCPAPAGLPPAAQRMAAVTVLMAMLWLTQLIPLAVTSLLPLVLFPLLGIQTAAVVSVSYVDRNIFLFLGGFIIALGIERTGLHRRMALHIIRLVGTSPKRLVLGFMSATAFLSMWISNTASTLLMTPIAIALLSSLQEYQSDEQRQDRLPVVLLLGIAYAASIGGMMTLVGTPTNVSFVGIWESRFPDAPAFSAGSWMATWVPVGVVMLVVVWLWLTRSITSSTGDRKDVSGEIHQRLAALGRPTRAERVMLVIFVTTALLWIFRVPLKFDGVTVIPGWQSGVTWYLTRMGVAAEIASEAVHDSTVAIAMAVLMFCIPIGREPDGRPRMLMDWETAERLPWGILLLIGGGFAIAGGFRDTKLAEWLGIVLADGLQGLDLWLLVLLICLLLTFLTEFTTNVATVNTVLPILAGTALSLGIDPRVLMVPAVISASCAFMLPIATPPNAIVFGSGRITIRDMARAGFMLNLICAVIIMLVTVIFLSPQWTVDAAQPPDWFGTP